MSKYLVTRKDDDGKAITMTFEFGDDQFKFLISWKVQGEWPLWFWRDIWKYPPLAEAELLKWGQPNTTIEKVADDLSFAAFWAAYKNSLGDKKKAQKLWELMPDEDKIAALISLPKYHYWLACKNGIEQLHATTYLNQRRWENDYTIKKN